jgi:hypothetical protein
MNRAWRVALAGGLLLLAGCAAAFYDEAPDNIDLLIAGGIAAASLLRPRRTARRGRSARLAAPPDFMQPSPPASG